MTAETDLRSYSERGRGRSASDVLAAARQTSIDPYVRADDPSRGPASRPVRALIAAGLVLGVGGVAVALVNQASPRDGGSPYANQITAASASESGSPVDLAESSGQELEDATGRLTPDQRQQLALLQSDLRSDAVPVESPYEDISGFVTSEAFLDMTLPNSNADLHPVVDGEGNLIAYWGAQIGIISITQVESEVPIDFASLSYERSHAGS